MRKGIVTFILITCVLLAACSGPAATPTPAPSAGMLSVVDFLGREVTLEKPAQRIVSLTPSNTELVFALGLGDRLVGVDALSNYPEAAAAITKVGDYSGPNFEAIVGLEPDLVLAGNKLQAETVQQLEEKGLKVIAAEANRYEEIYTSIDMIAGMCQVRDKADELKSSMRAKEQEIKDVVKGKTPVRVYHVLSYGEFGDYTIGSNNFITDLLTLAGADVVTKNHEVSWPKYSIEQLLADDPDYLLYDAFLDADDLKAATGYKDLTAVKAGRMLSVDPDKISRPTNRCVEEALRIAKELYK
ncbi:MAG TPA: ABC transporter substrate-binding protein [Clostridia bacterium]|nr:ABC transporter substrate-binding protein [Clostridia bacterium]